MIIRIPAPCGCTTTSIKLDDIIRIEASSLSFFNEHSYNLYIMMRNVAKEECFHLFSYSSFKDMQKAYKQLSALLKEKPRQDLSIQMQPVVV